MKKKLLPHQQSLAWFRALNKLSQDIAKHIMYDADRKLLWQVRDHLSDASGVLLQIAAQQEHQHLEATGQGRLFTKEVES